jgi:hypothetical protein
LVYGDVAGRLVYMRRDDARDRAALLRAIGHARTWGEFRALAPPRLYEEVMGRFEPTYESMEQFEAEFLADRQGASSADARAAYRDLVFDDRLPEDDDPFERDDVPGFEGIWGFPAQEMLDWVPGSIQDEFGHVVDTTLDGLMLEFKPQDEERLCRAFAAEGYVCARDDALVSVVHDMGGAVC